MVQHFTDVSAALRQRLEIQARQLLTKCAHMETKLQISVAETWPPLYLIKVAEPEIQFELILHGRDGK